MPRRRLRSSRRGPRAGRAWVLASSATGGGAARRRLPRARAAELDPTGRPPPRQSDGLDAVTRLRIWYEGLDGLNKVGVWAAALFALYFLSIIMGGSRRGYAPPRRRTYDDYRPSYYGGGGGGLGTMGLGGSDARSVEASRPISGTNRSWAWVRCSSRGSCRCSRGSGGGGTAGSGVLGGGSGVGGVLLVFPCCATYIS